MKKEGNQSRVLSSQLTFCTSYHLREEMKMEVLVVIYFSPSTRHFEVHNGHNNYGGQINEPIHNGQF